MPRCRIAPVIRPVLRPTKIAPKQPSTPCWSMKWIVRSPAVTVRMRKPRCCANRRVRSVVLVIFMIRAFSSGQDPITVIVL